MGEGVVTRVPPISCRSTSIHTLESEVSPEYRGENNRNGQQRLGSLVVVRKVAQELFGS